MTIEELYDLLWNLADPDCPFCGNCGFDETTTGGWQVCICVTDNATPDQLRRINATVGRERLAGVEVGDAE